MDSKASASLYVAGMTMMFWPAGIKLVMLMSALANTSRRRSSAVRKAGREVGFQPDSLHVRWL